MAEDVEDEFDTFLRVVRSTNDIDQVNSRLATARLRRLRSRMIRLDEYTVRPLRLADPVRHLDNALGFVLTAMGRHEVADGLWSAPRMRAYRLIVGYMREYLVRANAYCYDATIAELRAAGSPNPPVVHLTEATFRRYMQQDRDAPCSHLLASSSSSRWMNGPDRRRVRSAIRHIFADWETEAGGGVTMFLVYDHYERLSRDGVIRLAPGGVQLAHVNVPPDRAHPLYALLQAFVRSEYTTGYVDRLMRSMCDAFAPPLLEAVAAACANHPDGTRSLDENTVTEAVRELNVSWFAEDTETPELADMYYAHCGFHPV